MTVGPTEIFVILSLVAFGAGAVVCMAAMTGAMSAWQQRRAFYAALCSLVAGLAFWAAAAMGGKP